MRKALDVTPHKHADYLAIPWDGWGRYYVTWRAEDGTEWGDILEIYATHEPTWELLQKLADDRAAAWEEEE